MTPNDALSRDEAGDQIPWLINGTLDEEVAKAVEAYIMTCPECSAELDRQRRINEAIQDFDTPIPDQAAALEAIAHRLTPQQGKVGFMDRIKVVLGRLSTPTGAVLGGAVALGAVILVFGLSVFEPRFETLTSPDAVTDGIEIRLRFQPDASADEIRELMAKAGAVNITGPSETGLIRGVVGQELADEVVEQLKTDPRIVFITRDN